MEKIKKLFAHKIFKIFKWAFLVLIIIYVVGVAWRFNYRQDLEKINLQVEKIHNTKLTIDDVMGVNLPPDPGALADATVQGVDANDNGIRDDVELAVFKEYPNSAKTRAVLLQYALALQMMSTQSILNELTATAVMQEKSRAYSCIGEILVKDESDEKIMENYFNTADKLRFFVNERQLNMESRVKNDEAFYKKVRSYKESQSETCDIDYSKLPN